MAIPLTSMRDTLRGLEAKIAIIDEAASHGWAVYYDYHHEDMTYRIAKVEPWDPWEHVQSSGLMKIEEAPDELGAYVEAMRRLDNRSVERHTDQHE